MTAQSRCQGSISKIITRFCTSPPRPSFPWRYWGSLQKLPTWGQPCRGARVRPPAPQGARGPRYRHRPAREPGERLLVSKHGCAISLINICTLGADIKETLKETTFYAEHSRTEISEAKQMLQKFFPWVMVSRGTRVCQEPSGSLCTQRNAL